MKDVASSQREQDIHHHITGGMPWVGQGHAWPAAAGGHPCPGWAELPAGNLNLEGLLKSPLVLGLRVGACCTIPMCSGPWV